MINQLLNTPHVDQKRCSGRTTAMALKFISQAIQNPNTPVKISDHYATIDMANYMLSTIMYLVSKLELKHFKYNKKDLTITCNIFKPEGE